jgi:ankyrin repeat protein
MSAANGEVSMMLLQHGANVNAATRLGWTALYAVFEHYGNVPLAVVLLSNGADVDALATQKRQVWSADHTSTTILVRDETPLHVAVRALGPVPPGLVTILLDHGANIEAKESTGKTPLLLAIATDGYYPPNEDIVNCLLGQGADTEAVDGSGRNATHLAAFRQYRINDARRFERKITAKHDDNS